MNAGSMINGAQMSGHVASSMGEMHSAHCSWPQSKICDSWGGGGKLHCNSNGNIARKVTCSSIEV